MRFSQEERKPQGLQYCPGTLNIWASVFTPIPGISVQLESRVTGWKWILRASCPCPCSCRLRKWNTFHYASNSFVHWITLFVGSLHVTLLSPHMMSNYGGQLMLWYWTNSILHLSHFHIEPDFGEYPSSIQTPSTTAIVQAQPQRLYRSKDMSTHYNHYYD